MKGTFWSHTLWYLLLAAVSIGLFVFLWIKSNNRKLMIGFFFAVMGLTFYSETVLLTLLYAYQYLPKLSRYPFLDSIIGNYFSQFALTVTAVLVSTLSPPKIWNFIIAAVFCLIEFSFLQLGIYEHKGYQTWHTFVLVLLLLWISQLWYRHMIHSPKKPIFYVTLFLGANAAYSVTMIFLLYVFSIQVFNIVVFDDDYYRNQAVSIVSYRSITILFMMILYCSKWSWRWRGAGFVFLFLMNYILVKLGIQTFKDGLFWPVTLANIFASYFWVAVIGYLLKKRQGYANIG